MTSADFTVLTESLGGSSLSRMGREGQLPDWYRPIPRGNDAWLAYAASVRRTSPQWLDRLDGAIAARGAAAVRLAASAGGKGIVITTGQQPGLFGGPIMTLAKAITARAVADELRDRLGIPVAPLFWAATDDADFDEASGISVALDGGARELRLERRAAPGTPMSRVGIDDDILALAAVLRDACGSSPHAAYLDAALRAYRDGVTVGDAYVSLLRELLEPLEIAVLDASHPCVTEAAAPVLHRAAERADAVADAVRARTAALVAADYTPQVEEVPGLSLVFLNADGTKRRLQTRQATVLGPLPRHGFLSSTVLLRPVVERAILPAAAYVGGPGEVAYFAQVSAVADAIDVEAPLVLPRWSTTIIPGSTRRSLDALGLRGEDLASPHEPEGRLARQAVPPDVSRALDALRSHITSNIGALRDAQNSLVPAEVFVGLERSIEHRLQRVERRILAGVKRREGAVMHQVATVRGVLYPHGVRQERKLAYIPLLARHGPPLLDAMLDAARAHARSLVARDAPLPVADAVPIAQ